MTADEGIRGADGPLWEKHPPEPRCACGTPGFYYHHGTWYCPACAAIYLQPQRKVVPQ